MPSPSSTTNRFLLGILATAALFTAGHALRHTASCFLLSFVIAYLLDPFVGMLERRRLSRIQGMVVVYLVLAVLSIFFLSYVVPFLLIRWKALLPGIPLYLEKAKALGQELEGSFQPYYGAEEWTWAIDQAVEGANKLFSNLGAGVYSAAANMVFNLFNLVLSPILVWFMLCYKGQIKRTIAAWLPQRRQRVLLAIGNEVDESIGGYLRGQLLVSLIVALFSSIALFWLDVDYALFNGIFAGAASVLPFIGVFIAALPALFIAYLKFKTGLILLKVSIAFAAIYFLEGYLVKPLVFKSSMDLNPLLTIVMVMALGELFGFWGIILAIPAAATLRIVNAAFERGDFREVQEP